MSLLSQIFGGQRGAGSRVPIVNLALLGLLAYRTLKGKGRLADLFSLAKAPAAGTPADVALPAGKGGTPEPGDWLRNGLSGLFGAGAGGVLGGGLRDLIGQFRQKGAGETADSWVSTGSNRRISAQELEQALGADAIDDLAAQAGVPREQLLAELSEKLPEVVDKLTPDGRLPTEAEAASWDRDEPRERRDASRPGPA